MAKVIINKALEDEINKKFKGESVEIFELLSSLEENPHKGKALGQIGGILIKELKYKSYRFYFIVEGFKLKVYSEDELKELLLRFVRMSDKNNQQKVINEIKEILIKVGEIGFK